MSHSALPGSSPLFLIVHFPTALPNAVLSPLVQHYVCWGVVWGECANRKMATFSTLVAEEKKERERKVFINHAHLLWLVSHYILPARLASASLLPYHVAHLAGEAGITLWTLALFYRWQCMIGHHQWASHVQADVT